MRITMYNDINEITAEDFVINLFDVIKCAGANNNALEIRLNNVEVRALGEHVKSVNWIEINEGGKA